MSSENDTLEMLGVSAGKVMFSSKTKYAILRLLGEGGFGAVYLVQDMQSRDKERPSYAVKVEKKLERRRHSKLKMEIAILKDVSKLRDTDNHKTDRFLRHFTDIVDRAKKDRYFFLVMQLVGKSLDDLKRANKEKVLSLGTGLSSSSQCLEAVQCLHEIGYIHRDLKPENFAAGKDSKSHVIYILDFGIARMYKKLNDQGKYEFKTPRDMVLFKGTVKFASLACHKNVEMGPKDDCESWLYLLLDLVVPKGLPWKREYDKHKVCDIKDECQQHPEIMVKNFSCAGEFVKISNYLKGLEYQDIVDYEYIHGLLSEAGKKAGVSLDAPYEWETNVVPASAPSVEHK